MHFEVLFILFQINVMLHNAGKSQRARWEYTDLEVDKDVFNLNVFSVVNLSRCIMPHFMERNSGTFALMSSTAGKVLLTKSCGNPYDKRSDKTVKRLTRRRFSQKTNEIICFVCFFAFHGKQNKFIC